MRTKMFLMALALVGVFLAGCDKDDDGMRVDQNIKNAFRSQYPGATRAEWEHKHGYYVVDFRLNSREAEAWYSAQAVWYMTETDVRYADLPQAVKSAF